MELSAESPSQQRRVVHGVVLAAGAGRRMGRRPKLLLAHEGRTIIEHSVGAVLAAGLERTVVVLGHKADTIRRILTAAWPDRPDLRLVENPDYLSGQAGSIRAGLLATSAHGVLFHLADQPLVGPGVIRGLVQAYLAGPEAPAVVAPTCGGRRGNPVLIDRRLFPLLLSLTGDRGPGALLPDYAAATILVDAGPEVLMDIDTPDDYDGLRRPGSPTSKDGNRSPK
jgi:molybdenum cofactor cytidylyltransferase